MHPRGYLRVPAGPGRRLLFGLAGLALTLGALPVLTGAAPGTGAAPARALTTSACPTSPAGVTTASQDALRTGWDNCESPGLMGPAAVAGSPSTPGSGFQERWRTNVGGQVFAQPLVIGNTVFIATENDWTFGLDRTTGKILWQTHLGNGFVIAKAPSKSLHKCTDLTPNVGVTGTPAVDPATGYAYMFAKIMAGKQPQYYLVGVNPANGKIVKKIKIAGHPSNAPKASFNAQFEQERPGVLISGGAAYGAWAGHCDVRPYDGYVARVDLSTGKVSLWNDESGLTNNRAGIWDSGGGVMTDPANPGAGIFVTSGNGVSPAPGPGTKPPGQLAESVINLRVNANGTMVAHDFFSPTTAPKWDAADTDFGSGSPVGLPFGTTSYPHVLAQAGKDGQIFLLNRDSLGGRDQGPNKTDAALSETIAYGGLWGHPAIFEDGNPISAATNDSANNYLFYDGKADKLRALRIQADGSGKPVLADVANSSLTYYYTSGSPVVTSDGYDPSSAVVWVVHANDKTGTNAELDAYSLQGLVNSSGSPSACTTSNQCTLQEIWHSPNSFTAAKFSIPATSGGWVFLGTRGTKTEGQVIGYSLASTNAPVKPAAATTFSPTAVNGTSTRTVSVTAARAVTFTGVSTSAGAANTVSPGKAYTVASVSELKKGASTPQPVKFPVTLAAGDKLTATVRFTPATPGTVNGTLVFTTPRGGGMFTRVPLAGDGIKDGISAQVPSVAFQLAPDQNVFTVPAGMQLPETVQFTNYGTTPQKVASVSLPGAPFTVVDPPSVGDVIKPGQTISVQVILQAAQAGPVSRTLSIAGSSGPAASVTLTATAIPAVSKLTAATGTVSFGTIPVGKQATAYIRITNTGNQASTITTTSGTGQPFAAVLTPPALMPLNPEYDMSIPVRFTPTQKGSFTSHYTLHWRDSTGSHSLTVTLTGKAA